MPKKSVTTEYTVLNEDLKTGSFKPVYLLYGEESYLKDTYERRLSRQIGGDDGINVQRFDENLNVDELIASLETVPFLAPSRLVIVRNSGYFKKECPAKLLLYLPKMPSYSHLLFVEKEVMRRTKLWNYTVKVGRTVEMTVQDEKTLLRFAGTIVQNAGKKIRISTMQLVLNASGPDMYRLKNETEKLISYVGEREVIEDEDVRAVCTVNPEDRVFEMIDALSTRNTAKVMSCYSDLLKLQVEPMKILSLMRRRFNQLILARECVTAGKNRQDSMSYIGVNNLYAVGRLMDESRHYTVDSLTRYIARCYQYDTAVKSGNLSGKMAVELLLTV